MTYAEFLKQIIRTLEWVRSEEHETTAYLCNLLGRNYGNIFSPSLRRAQRILGQVPGHHVDTLMAAIEVLQSEVDEGEKGLTGITTALAARWPDVQGTVNLRIKWLQSLLDDHVQAS